MTSAATRAGGRGRRLSTGPAWRNRVHTRGAAKPSRGAAAACRRRRRRWRLAPNRAAQGSESGLRSGHGAVAAGVPADEGVDPQARGQGLRLPRRRRRPAPGRRGRADPVPGHPAGLARRVDLPVPQRPHPGRSAPTRAGRRQYLYHPDWRTKRDELKFDRVKVAGTRLARARERIIEDLQARGDAALARRRDGHPAARPRLLPDRQRRLRRRQRLVRPDHPRAPARAAAGRRPRLQLRRQVGHRALDHDQRPARHRVAQPDAQAPRRVGPAARLPRRGAVGRPRRRRP